MQDFFEILQRAQSQRHGITPRSCGLVTARIEESYVGEARDSIIVRLLRRFSKPLERLVANRARFPQKVCVLGARIMLWKTFGNIGAVCQSHRLILGAIWLMGKPSAHTMPPFALNLPAEPRSEFSDVACIQPGERIPVLDLEQQ